MKSVRLGDFCSKIGSGATPRGGSEVYLPAGIPLIRSQNIYNDRFSRDGLAYIGDEHAKALIGVTVENGDILLNITGDSVARVNQVPSDITPARVIQHVAIIRPAPEFLDAKFVRYYLASPTMQSRMLGLAASGATRNALTKGMIENFRVPCPDLMEQRAIAGTLGALDDKIDLNCKMNKTLEAIARAIFKSWFVDFDPVRAKMGGRDPVGMDGETAALFPDTFENSASGEIPKGWHHDTIGNVTRVVGGSTPSTAEPQYWETGTHYWATPRDLSRLSNPVLLETERLITDAGVQQISSGVLPVGTVLLSSRAPIGYLAIAQAPVSINQGFIAMICDGSLPNHYVLQWLIENMAVIKGRANGTTFQEISKSNFRPISVIVPPREVLNAFTAVAEPLHNKLVANLRESKQLAGIRDMLLPRLMSGEVWVRDAERNLETIG